MLLPPFFARVWEQQGARLGYNAMQTLPALCWQLGYVLDGKSCVELPHLVLLMLHTSAKGTASKAVSGSTKSWFLGCHPAC
jgi:hypothetical protein